MPSLDRPKHAMRAAPDHINRATRRVLTCDLLRAWFPYTKAKLVNDNVRPIRLHDGPVGPGVGG